MALLLNILWNIPGLGFVHAFLWLLAGVLMALTIIGLPWARACFTLASYTLAPFGRDLVSTRDLYGVETIGSGPLGLLANIIWLLLGGIWLFLAHLATALALAATIIGIPFAWAHVKLAVASLAPVGKRVVDQAAWPIRR